MLTYLIVAEIWKENGNPGFRKGLGLTSTKDILYGKESPSYANDSQRESALYTIVNNTFMLVTLYC